MKSSVADGNIALTFGLPKVTMTRILIVEDVPDNVELARKILTSRGYEVIHAMSAEMGYDLALQQHPDLVLLDLGLPDYDGLTLAGQLRENPVFERLPIIAFTAWPQDTAKTMAESYGCDGFISKPIIRVNDFISQVENFLPKN
ncbi:MAG: response regulator [Anaerolineales bacterium]